MRKAITAAALTAFAAFAPAFAFAQQEADAITVTATRFSEDARRLPASTTVLTEEDIRKSAARTLPELLQEQTGITMKDFFGNNASSTAVDMRGYGITGGQNTLILLDGRRITDVDLTSVQWAAIPLAGIERIEILRGTGAVLYGDGASAGVINIVTRSPLKQGAALELLGRVATFNTQEAQVYGSYASGIFGINASAYRYSSDGYRANNRNEQANGTANLRWALGSATLDLRFGSDSQELGLPGARRIQPSIGLDEYRDDPRGAQTPNDHASRDGKRAGITYQQAFGDAEFSIGLDWRNKHQRAAFLQQFRAQDDALQLWSLTPRLRVPFQTGSMRHRLTVGADFNSWRYDSRRDTSADNLGQPVNRVKATEKTEAFYIQDLIDLSSATRLTLGARTERVRYDASDTLDPAAPSFCPFPPFCQASAGTVKEKQSQDAWEIGLRHALTGEWSLLGRAGKSFRFVNLDEIYEFTAFGDPQFQILRPQQAETIEGGAEWRAGRHFARAVLFRTDVTDEIHLDPFTAGVGNRNLPPSRRKGIELDGAWQATPSLRLTAGYAFTDARFLSGTLPGGAPPFGIGTNLNIAGKHVPLVPEHKLNAGFAWDITGRARLSGGLTYYSEQYMDNDEPNTLGVKIPAATVVDLKYSYGFDWGRISLAVNNLFGEDYYSYAVRSQFTADRYAVYPLPGRTVGLTAEFKLD